MGAYHYADGSDPIRQADHFLSVVSSSWAQANPAVRPSAGVLLVLDFEKNGHYPGGTMRADQAVAFVERIRSRTGVYPGIYSGEYHLAQVLNSTRVTPAQNKHSPIAGSGLQITRKSRVQRRHGITGLCGNTAAMVNAIFRAPLTP